VDFVSSAGGGGGGAGGNGTPASAGSIGNPGTPGNGGPGIIPPPSSFGPWGTDIGENGYFGGGGGGGNFSGTYGTPGIGNGAPGTGGGATTADDPFQLTPESGYSGTVVIMYQVEA
jgi:hypothetical protein